MLMKLTPGLNFINILRTAFTLVGPTSVRIQSSSQYLFMLLGLGAKAAHRLLMKFSPALSPHPLIYIQKDILYTNLPP